MKYSILEMCIFSCPTYHFILPFLLPLPPLHNILMKSLNSSTSVLCILIFIIFTLCDALYMQISSRYCTILKNFPKMKRKLTATQRRKKEEKVKNLNGRVKGFPYLIDFLNQFSRIFDFYLLNY